MSVSLASPYRISLDLKDNCGKVDTLYVKQQSQGISLEAEIYDNGVPVSLGYQVGWVTQVALYSNYSGYISSQGYPHTATISGVNNNIATFDLTGVFNGGWTVCTIRITKQSTTETHVYETRNFQIYSENPPDPVEGGSSSYVLPTASEAVKGGIKIGEGLGIDNDACYFKRPIAHTFKAQQYNHTQGQDIHQFTGTVQGPSGTLKRGDIIVVYFSGFNIALNDDRVQVEFYPLTYSRQWIYADHVTCTKLEEGESGSVGFVLLYTGGNASASSGSNAIFLHDIGESRKVDDISDKSHTHTNKTVLDKFSYSNGLKYDGNPIGVQTINNITIDFSAKSFGMYGECITTYSDDTSNELPANSSIVDVGLIINNVECKLKDLASYNFNTSNHTLIAQINDHVSGSSRLLFTLMSSVYEDSISNQISVHPIVQDIADGTLYECKVYYTSGA